MADTLNKKCYIALMPDSSLVITDNHNHIAGARQEWVFDPATNKNS